MKLVAMVAPYDKVTEDEGPKPTRPAPPVPSQQVIEGGGGILKCCKCNLK